MADSNMQLCLRKLLGLLAFTTIAALALIISGITLSAFPTELSRENKHSYTIEYTHCEPFAVNRTCEDEFKRKMKCQCFVDNIKINLHGNVVVHCQLEISNRQDSKVVNSSVKTFGDIISNSSGQCDPYKMDQPVVNETCEAIPDALFKDHFKLIKSEYSEDFDVGNFSKSVRWSADVNNSPNDFQNKIIVLMNSDWVNDTKGLGNYSLYINFYPVNIPQSVRRYIIFSEAVPTHTHTHRSTVIEIVALVLGLVLLGLSIALFALRKRLLGIQSTTATLVTANTPAANNRLSVTRPEETPLSSPVDNN